MLTSSWRLERTLKNVVESTVSHPQPGGGNDLQTYSRMEDLPSLTRALLRAAICLWLRISLPIHYHKPKEWLEWIQ